MRLNDEEMKLVRQLENETLRSEPRDIENRQYYDGKQPIRFLGLRLREEWLRQAFPLSWCRTLVNVIVERQQVLRILRRGQFTEDEKLRHAWDSSDMDSQLYRLSSDLAIYGRCCVSVANTERGVRMQAEPVRAMSVTTDYLGRTIAALRTYTDSDGRQVRRTLYLPNSTIILNPSTNEVIERHDHYLGRVPVVMAVMNDVDGDLRGQPAFEAIKPLANMSAETLLNARVALETTASPTKVFLDAVADVQDEEGNAASVFDAFYDSVLTLFSSNEPDSSKQKADVKQLPGADMTGFLKTLDMLGQQASSASGLPMRMLGHVTANPPSEMTVRGEESRLVRTVENYNAALGAMLGWALGIEERLRTGQWPEDGSIDISWRDPGTPTYGQLSDALMKHRAAGFMSRRSALEELGWSDARIDREMERLEEEEQLGFSYRALARDPGDSIPASPDEGGEDE